MKTNTTSTLRIFMFCLFLTGFSTFAQPVITLIGNKTIYVGKGSPYTSPGATAYDTTDGNLTDSIKMISDLYLEITGIYTEQYSVKNSKGQFAYASRMVIVTQETIPPVIKLSGPDTVYIEAARNNPDFQDPGATATDNSSPYNMTSSIVVKGKVNTRAVGTYILEYNVQDVAGNKSDTLTRTVIVGDTKAPQWNDRTNPRYLPFGEPFVDKVKIEDAYDGSIAMFVSHPVTGPVDVYTPGQYDYIYTAEADSSGNAPDTLFINYIVQAKVSIPETTFYTFMLYPDPVTEVLHIDLDMPAKELVQVKLFAADGRLLHNAAHDGNEQLRMDVSELTGGVYFVHIETAGKMYREKFIKE